MTNTLHEQRQVIQSLPSHLQPFAAYQDYSAYTARDQAVWRFLLHQLKTNLSQSAHPTYLEGLEKTGISIDEIPRIEHINSCLNKLGWQAVVVDGFLPPAVFMEFQALKVLVIAVNIRSFEHMLYTPAPDIVHESAGHAPFIIDIDYSEFLQRFGELGMQAIANKADMDVYEAIRNLSILKETMSSTIDEIATAESELTKATESNTSASESALLARLHWWTVEYGLVGYINDYHIFGAGLLSSLGESQHCLNNNIVAKKSLTVDAINTSYDITAEQPQLFITESCRHLSQILEEYARQMCCSTGGVESIEKVIDAATINTARTNSGIQISGKFSKLIKDAVGNIVYLNTDGPTQLSYQGSQLIGHGIEFHSQGFGSPVGKLIGIERCLSNYTVDELKRHNIELNNSLELNFLSGVTVKGVLKKLIRRDQKNILMTLEDCTVTDINREILFDPSWGVYDMAIGDSIVSVFGGSADQQHYPLYKAPSSHATETQVYDKATQSQFDLYQRIRLQRQELDHEDSCSLISEINDVNDADWLLLFEAIELTKLTNIDQHIIKSLTTQLMSCHSSGNDEVKTLIDYGLARIA